MSRIRVSCLCRRCGKQWYENAFVGEHVAPAKRRCPHPDPYSPQAGPYDPTYTCSGRLEIVVKT